MKMKGENITICIIIIIVIYFNLVGCTKQSTQEQGETATIGKWDLVSILTDQNFKYFKDTEVNGGEPITLNIYINEDLAENYEYLIDEYMKYRKNVDINLFVLRWKTYWTKLNIAMQMGNGPDLFHMHGAYSLNYAKYMLPLPFDKSALKQVFDCVEDAEIDGKLYFLNLGYSTSCIFYNKKLWEEAGLTDKDIPETWDELRIVAKKLVKYNEQGTIDVDGFNYNDDFIHLLIAMQLQRGIKVLDAENNVHFFNDSLMSKNVDFLRELYVENRVSSLGKEPACRLFGQEKAAMIYAWAWVANDLNCCYPNVEYGVFKLPTWEKGVPTAYDRKNLECSLAINSQIEECKKEVAQDLLLFYLANDEALLRTVYVANMIPTKKQLVYSNNEVLSILQTYIDRTVFLGNIPEDFDTYLKVNVENEWYKNLKIESEKIEEIDDELYNILQKYNFESKITKYNYYNEFH